ncbi:unnamed protein product [Linum trigynum]|uniref:RNase H type-1 domain-containing protein n=1 Tax=Linum trigynum TaxID=586398 RepID=A0AAV2G6N2_9ROSI
MALVVLLWRIWKSRNWAAFEGKQFLIPQLMRQYHQQLHKWVSIPDDRLVQDQVPLQRNLGEVGPSIVCIWDGAVCVGSHSAGGLILKDDGGSVVLARDMVFKNIVEPLLVETIVLREATQWCQDLGIAQVLFERDAKVLIDKINAAYAQDSRVG